MIPWLLIPVGILMIVLSEKVVRFTGEFAFAERWFGAGGTYTYIKLLGLLIAVLAFMWIVGGLREFLQSTLGVLIPGL